MKTTRNHIVRGLARRHTYIIGLALSGLLIQLLLWRIT